MIARIEDIAITNDRGKPLAGRIYSADADALGCVIFSHGLFSNKDGYKITKMAPDFVSAGFTLMTFDFSYATGSGGDIAGLSILQEVEDLAAAVKFFLDRGQKKIHLMGSSMGAAVTLLYAARGVPAVASLILIAAPVNLGSLFLPLTGCTDPSALPENGITKIDGIGIRNSFFREVAALRVADAIQAIKVPVLAFHGGRDAVVPPSNIDLLREGITAPFTAIVIEDGDHTLTRGADIARMRDATISWLREQS